MRRVAVAVVTALFFNTISPMAAIVSDNDGSAFVTKAEFEAMKKNFSEEITNYQDSITQKIDGAIASYLAGIKVSSIQKISNCDSKLDYPQKMYMKNHLLKWSDWDKNGKTPYWEPGYEIYFWGNRGTVFMCLKDKYTSTSSLDWFYQGTWDTTLNKFVTTGRLYDVKGNYNVYGSFYLNLKYDKDQTNQICITFDHAAKQAYNRVPTSGNYAVRTAAIRKSNTMLVPFNAKGTTLYHIVDAVWNWNRSSQFSWSSSENDVDGKYLDRLPNSGRPYIYYENVGYNDYSTRYALSYKSENIKIIYNNVATYSDTNDTTKDKHVEVPVAYTSDTSGTTIYLTNRDSMKRQAKTTHDYMSVINGYYYGIDDAGSDTSKQTQKFNTYWLDEGLITPGWTLEPQFTDKHAPTSTHSKQNKSLMIPSDVVYKVTTPVTDTVLYQQLNAGILISEAPTGTEDSTAYMTINISSENTSVDKYIVMSNSPITEGDISNVTGTSTGYIDIADNSSMTSKSKKMKLKEGDNNIFFKVTAKDKIYYKILWDKDNATYVSVTKEPTISVSVSK